VQEQEEDGQGQREAAQRLAQEPVEEVGDQPGRDERGWPDVVGLVQVEARVARGGGVEPVDDLGDDVLAGG
jgi:hypothetical protein